MKKEREYLDRHFGEFEPAPPLNVWKDIEKGLDRRNSVKRGIYFMRIAAGLALLITAIWFTWSGIIQQSEKPVVEKRETKIEEEIPPKSGEEKTLIIPQEKDSTGLEKKSEEVKPKTIQPAKKSYPAKSKSSISNYNMKLAEKSENKETGSDTTTKDKLALQLAETDGPEKEIQQTKEEMMAVKETKNTLASTKGSPGSSITIILRPEMHREQTLAEAGEEPRINLKKFRRILDRDLHKHQIDIGKKPTLALGKIKFNQIKLKNDENDQSQL